MTGGPTRSPAADRWDRTAAVSGQAAASSRQRFRPAFSRPHGSKSSGTTAIAETRRTRLRERNYSSSLGRSLTCRRPFCWLRRRRVPSSRDQISRNFLRSPCPPIAVFGQLLHPRGGGAFRLPAPTVPIFLWWLELEETGSRPSHSSRQPPKRFTLICSEI